MKLINIFTTTFIVGSALTAPTSHGHYSFAHHRNARHVYSRAEAKHQRYGHHSGSYNLSHRKNAHYAAYSRAETNHLRKVSHRKNAHHTAYSRAQYEVKDQYPAKGASQQKYPEEATPQEQDSFFARFFDLKDIIDTKGLYDSIQELADIPENKFTSGVNEIVQKLQSVLDISFDFAIRVESLDEKSREDLNRWLEEVAPFYEGLTEEELSTIQEDIAADLVELAQIVYKDKAKQFFEELKKQFPELF